MEHLKAENDFQEAREFLNSAGYSYMEDAANPEMKFEAAWKDHPNGLLVQLTDGTKEEPFYYPVGLSQPCHVVIYQRPFNREWKFGDTPYNPDEDPVDVSWEISFKDISTAVSFLERFISK